MTAIDNMNIRRILLGIEKRIITCFQHYTGGNTSFEESIAGLIAGLNLPGNYISYEIVWDNGDPTVKVELCGATLTCRSYSTILFVPPVQN